MTDVSIGSDDLEVHKLFGVPVTEMVNTKAGHHYDYAAVPFILNGVTDAKNIKLEVYKNGKWLEMTARQGTMPLFLSAATSSARSFLIFADICFPSIMFAILIIDYNTKKESSISAGFLNISVRIMFRAFRSRNHLCEGY